MRKVSDSTVLLTVEDIRKHYEYYGPTEKLHDNTAVQHIRFLLEEIDRLDSKLFELEETYK